MAWWKVNKRDSFYTDSDYYKWRCKRREDEQVFSKNTNFVAIKVGPAEIKFILKSIMFKMNDIKKFEKFFLILVELFHSDFNKCGVFLKLLKLVHIWSIERFDELVSVIDPDKLSEPHNFNYFNIILDQISITTITRFFSILFYYGRLFEFFKGTLKVYFYRLKFFKKFLFFGSDGNIKYAEFLNIYSDPFISKSILRMIKVKHLFVNLHFRRLLLSIIFLSKKTLFLRCVYLLKKIKRTSNDFRKKFCEKFEFFLIFFMRLHNEKFFFNHLKKKKLLKKSLSIVKNYGEFFLNMSDLRIKNVSVLYIFKKLGGRYYTRDIDISKPSIVYNDEWLYDDFLFKRAIDSILNRLNLYNKKFSLNLGLIYFWFLFFFNRFFFFFNKTFIRVWFYFFNATLLKLKSANFYKFFLNVRAFNWFCYNNDKCSGLGFYYYLLLNSRINFISDFVYFSVIDNNMKLFNSSVNLNMYCSILSDNISTVVLNEFYSFKFDKHKLKGLHEIRFVIRPLIYVSNLMDIEHYFSIFSEIANFTSDKAEACLSYLRDRVLLQELRGKNKKIKK